MLFRSSIVAWLVLTVSALAQGGMMPGPGTPHSAGGGPVSPFQLVAHAMSAPGVSSTTTPAINTSTANLCVAAISWAQSATGFFCSNITDSKSNTWLTAATPTGSTAGSGICYASPCTVGTGHTFTATTSNMYGALYVAAFKGAASPISSVASYENSSANSAGANATTIQAGTLSAQRHYMLGIAALTSTVGSGTFSISGSYASNITDQQPWGGNGGGGALAYNIQSTATADNPTWTSGSGILASSSAIFASNAAPIAPVAQTAPCDLLASGCQEAWSLTRRMLSTYSGPLFQIALTSSGATHDVGQSGGVVDMTGVSTFCGGTLANCHIVKIYSQVHTTSNNLHYSTITQTTPAPDCTPGSPPTRPPCASPLTLGYTTGLPEIVLNVSSGTPRLAYEYLIGTGTDGTSTGIASGASDRSLVEIFQFQAGVAACCGHFGPTAHTLGVAGSSYLLVLGYGDPGGGLMECATLTGYCIAIDCETGSGCVNSTYPPAPIYSAALPTNAGVAIGKYNSSTRVNSVSINAVNMYTITAASGFMATGTHFALGGGGDFSTPSPAKWWEGFITSTSMSSTDETNLTNNARAFYPMAVFP